MSICILNNLHFKLYRQAVFYKKPNSLFPFVAVVRYKQGSDNLLKKRIVEANFSNNRNKDKTKEQRSVKFEPIKCKPSNTPTKTPCDIPSACKPPPPPADQLKLIGAILVAAGLGGLAILLFKKQDSKTCPKIPVEPPITSKDLPKHVPYLLIGGGTASFSAFRAIKSNDPKAKILMLSSEKRKPYMRPPLSKELWYTAQKGPIGKDYRFKQWTGNERSLFFEPDEFFVSPRKLMSSENGGISVAEGFKAKKIDPSKQIVTLEDGTEIKYDKCLVATGCTPKILPVFKDVPNSVKERVFVYRTTDDFEKVKKFIDCKKSVTIIGSGFLGSELACSIATYAKPKPLEINQVFAETGNMSKILPHYLSLWTMKKLEAIGICVIPNTIVKECKRDEDKLKLTLSNGKIILTDFVVVCAGCEPNIEIGLDSGLEIDKCKGGFVVNAELEARSNLYVAGDVSCFFDPLLGRRRVEHHDHSVVSGRLAGENMVGKSKPYRHQSMFWSDLGPEISYEGIGLVDASLPTVGIFASPSKPDRKTDNLEGTPKDAKIDIKFDDMKKIDPKAKQETQDKMQQKTWEEFGKGVIFYLKDDKVVGILLWNIFNRIGLARAIIKENRHFDDLNELAKLFEIHS